MHVFKAFYNISGWMEPEPNYLYVSNSVVPKQWFLVTRTFPNNKTYRQTKSSLETALKLNQLINRYLDGRNLQQKTYTYRCC